MRMIARVVTLVLGIALAVMARWDPPGSDVFWHDLVIGLVIAFLSLAGMFMRGANYFLTALGLDPKALDGVRIEGTVALPAVQFTRKDE